MKNRPPFLAAVVILKGMGQPEGVFHHPLIQDRAPGFQRIFHGSAIHLAENIPRQVGVHVQEHPADLPVFHIIIQLTVKAHLIRSSQVFHTG